MNKWYIITVVVVLGILGYYLGQQSQRAYQMCMETGKYSEDTCRSYSM